MDDLRMLSTLLTKPAPTPEVTERGRRRLREAAFARRRRRVTWPLIGLGLAGAATAIVAAFGATGDRPPTGRRFLLAAAATVESKPPESGTYWHIKTLYSSPEERAKGKPSPQELYIRRDGQKWIATTGGVIKLPAHALPVFYASRLRFPDIQTLPTEPGALEKTLLDRMTPARKAEIERGGGEFKEEVTCETLVTLLELPAPPKVRAAAFRALAAIPDVKSLGRVNGGIGLVYAPKGFWRVEWIVDPTTFLIRTEGRDRSSTGEWPMFRTDIPIAEWTDRLPKVIDPRKTPHRPATGRP